MSGFGNDFESNWDWLPGASGRSNDDAQLARKARENSPSAVLGEMGVILAVTLAVAVATDVALNAFQIG